MGRAGCGRAAGAGSGCAAGARRAGVTMIEPSMRQQSFERRRDLERLASCSSSLARTVCSTCGRAGTGAAAWAWEPTCELARNGPAAARGARGVPCSRSRKKWC